MKLRTYQAYSMAEALAAVKRDLGAGAVILHTRTFKRGGVLGLWRKTIVEVTARPPEAASGMTKKRAPAREVKPETAAARRAYAGTKTALIEEVGEIDRERTRKLAIAMAEKFEREKQKNATVVAAAPPQQQVAVVQPPPVATLAAQVSQSPKRFVLTPNGEPSHASATVRADVPANGSAAMQEELVAIRTLVGQVLQRQSRAGTAAPSMPPKLFEMYLKLIAQDMSEELADRVVSEVRGKLRPEELEDESHIRDAVLRALGSAIPIAEQAVAVESVDGRPLTIALVGPTGVGKTTTIAKLAASFKLRQGRKVGLITSDTYRIAAVDQLRTYANIIGLPLQVALTPAEMKQAVHSLRECDVILIDTAGRGQNDTSRLDELAEFIHAASPHEVHLVLSGTAGEKVLLREAEAFSPIGIHKIVLTKLDEAVSFGMLVDVIRRIGKELSFITTGQEVPNHIEAGRPERLAELILGGEVNG